MLQNLFYKVSCNENPYKPLMKIVLGVSAAIIIAEISYIDWPIIII